MAREARQYELTLLGATGYTGKIVAEWISTHLPTDLKWAIAGRNTRKLESVIDELKSLSPNRTQPGKRLIVDMLLSCKFASAIYFAIMSLSSCNSHMKSTE